MADLTRRVGVMLEPPSLHLIWVFFVAGPAVPCNLVFFVAGLAVPSASTRDKRTAPTGMDFYVVSGQLDEGSSLHADYLEFVASDAPGFLKKKHKTGTGFALLTWSS